MVLVCVLVLVSDRVLPTQVNPAVLGGVVVDFGDKTIDLSVASRVNKLNNLLSRKFHGSLSVEAGLTVARVESV